MNLAGAAAAKSIRYAISMKMPKRDRVGLLMPQYTVDDSFDQDMIRLFLKETSYQFRKAFFFTYKCLISYLFHEA